MLKYPLVAQRKKQQQSLNAAKTVLAGNFVN